ncbi:hypothetical protein VTP01DRAFT_10295 [Rhizomucor pusillus]|uniref:uncharacterized protein n=1 Tax=Rhizomucor pusillus TaxID=4840 RepID=UPI00374475A3
MLSISTAELSPWTTSSTKSSMLLKRQVHTRSICVIFLERATMGSHAMQTEVAKKDVDVRMRDASVKRAYTLYTDQDKLDVHVRTAQRWAKQYEEDPDSIFEKRKNIGRPRILGEEQKRVILEYVEENPSAVLEELMERLLQRNSEEKIQERLGWVRKWERTDMDFRINCVFLDEPAFHINMKRSMAWSKKGSPGVVIVPKTRAQTTTISVAISASYLVKCSLRMPQPPAKKSKRGAYEQGTIDELPNESLLLASICSTSIGLWGIMERPFHLARLFNTMLILVDIPLGA